MKTNRKASTENAKARRDKSSKTVLGVRPVAVLELIIFFAIALAIDFLLLEGTRFGGVNPHPFWLPVIFLAIQYGTNGGLLAAFAATAALLIGNLPEQQLSQDLYGYALDISLQPIMWQAAAVVVGELHGRQVRDRQGLRSALAKTVAEKDMIATSYLRLREVKETLEMRLAAQVRTLSSTYQATQAIQNGSTDDVLAGINGFVQEMMAPEKFSLFTVTEGGLVASVTGGWSAQNEHATVFAPGTPLYDQVVGHQAVLTAADPQHEGVLRGEGLLAGAIRSEGRVIGMLKIEAMSFAEFNSCTAENFRIMCDWISDALTMAALREKNGRTGEWSSDAPMAANALRPAPLALARRVA